MIIPVFSLLLFFAQFLFGYFNHSPKVPEGTVLSQTTTRKQVDIEIDRDDVYLGDPNAKLVLVEFVDFTSTKSAVLANEIIPSLVKEYVDTGKLGIAVKFLTSDGANAAICAKEQNKFWRFYYAYFQDWPKVKIEESDCLNRQKYADQIKRDNDEAEKNGISTGGDLVLGGYIVEQPWTLPKIKAEIDVELAKESK